MADLEAKFQEFGTTLELASEFKRLEHYTRLDQLIAEINQLIFGGEQGSGILQKLANPDVEGMLRAFRDRYKGLLAKLGIYICPTRMIVTRKKKSWKKKRPSQVEQMRKKLKGKRKVFCQDCGQYHFV